MPSSVFEEAASPRIQIDSSFAGIWTGKLRTFDLNIKEPTDDRFDRWPEGSAERDNWALTQLERFNVAYARTVQTYEDHLARSKERLRNTSDPLLRERAQEAVIATEIELSFVRGAEIGDGEYVPFEWFGPKVAKAIKEEGKTAERAVYDLLQPKWVHFEKGGGDFRAKATELKQIMRTYLQHIDPSMQPQSLADLSKDEILLMDEIPLGMLDELVYETGEPRTPVILSKLGTLLSHGFLVCKSVGINACRIPEQYHPQIKNVKNGDTIIIDGEEGVAIVNPSVSVLNDYKKRAKDYNSDLEILIQRSQKKRNPTSTDDVEFRICANVARPIEAKSVNTLNAGAIGLVRPEIFALSDEGGAYAITEEEWYNYGHEIVKNANRTNTTFRLPDFTGDKVIEGMTPEMKMEIERRYVRALLALRRDFPDKKIHVMMPLVHNNEELEDCQGFIDDLAEEMGLPTIHLGCMGEVTEFFDDLEAGKIHPTFISVGTNDWITELLDIRRFESGEDKYDTTDPYVLMNLCRPIKHQKTMAEPKIPISLCGDMASEPSDFAILVGLGYRRLSLAPKMIPVLKELARRIDTGERYAHLEFKDPKAHAKAVQEATINDNPDNAWALAVRIMNEPDRSKREVIRNRYNEAYLGLKPDDHLYMRWPREDNAPTAEATPKDA
jgi:phosphotransferase system enzyme I (PtsI)